MWSRLCGRVDVQDDPVELLRLRQGASGVPWSTLREVGREGDHVNVSINVGQLTYAARPLRGRARRELLVRRHGDTTSDVPGQARCGRARPDIRLCAAPPFPLSVQHRTAPGTAEETVRTGIPRAAVHESDGNPRHRHPRHRHPRHRPGPSRPRSASPAPRSHTRRDRMDMTAKNLQELLDETGDTVGMLRNAQLGTYIYPVVP